MDLPHSDAPFMKAYPAETTEAFLDGHVSAFSFFGGIPQSILYDNTKLAVAKICGDGKRERTRAFSELVTICFGTGSAGQERGTTKAKLRGWSRTAGGGS
jgi:transposase